MKATTSPDEMISKPPATQDRPATIASDHDDRGRHHSEIPATRKEEAPHRFSFVPSRSDENDHLAGNADAPSEPRLVALKTPPPVPLRREPSRGPLKKRPTSPIPHRGAPSHKPLVAQASLHSMPSAPLLRQSSSSFSVYSHHQHFPPQLCLTSSCGRQLMSEPLLATPNHVGVTPRSALAPGNSDTGQLLAVGEPLKRHRHQHQQHGNATPGLDLLADQVVMSGRRVAHPVPVTAPRSTETKRLPMHASYLSSSSAYNHRHHYPTPPGVPRSGTGYWDQSSGYGGYHSYPPPTHHYGRPYEYEYEYVPPPRESHAQRIHTIPPSGHKNHQSRPRVAVLKKEVAKYPGPYLPPEDPVASLPALFADAPTTRKSCKCGNSQCLKLYCECFHNGALCDSEICRCADCKNNDGNNEPKGAREYAILKIMAKRPDAFHHKVKRRTGNWCKCKKSKYVPLSMRVFLSCAPFIFFSSVHRSYLSSSSLSVLLLYSL